MSRSLLLAGLALGTTTLQAANTATFDLTLTSANGGADTLVTWSLTGSPTIAPTASQPLGMGIYGIGWGSGAYSDAFTSITGSSYKAYTGSFASITGLSTGLVLTNTTTQASRNLTALGFSDYGTFTYIDFGWTNAFQTQIAVGAGEALVLSGPSSGSFLSGIAFENFNEGQWVLSQTVYSNFSTVLTVGAAAVPEPSTYGLALGGLALAVVALSRRTSKPKA
jgi:hypothetical protein